MLTAKEQNRRRTLAIRIARGYATRAEKLEFLVLEEKEAQGYAALAPEFQPRTVLVLS